jgi:molybdopterin converting factor subunit 1
MSQTRRITVKFFALLREQAGCREATLATTAPTPDALYAELTVTHGLKVPQTILTYAVNERYVPGDTPLSEGDRVAFIPPVAGG